VATKDKTFLLGFAKIFEMVKHLSWGGTNVDRERDDLIRPPCFLLGIKVDLNSLIIRNLKYRYRVTPELSIAIKYMCCGIEHPALRWIVTNTFETSAASTSGSTVHFIYISTLDTTVSVTFPAASGRVQFWSHSRLFRDTSVFAAFFFFLHRGQIKVLKLFPLRSPCLSVACKNSVTDK
jgi:hypothetical protein